MKLQKTRLGLDKLFLILALATCLEPAQSFADAKDNWVFTPHYAVSLPKDWKVLSQTEVDGIGHELFAGLSREHHTRIFVSGAKLSNEEFQRRMKALQEAETKSVPQKQFLLRPQLTSFPIDQIQGLRFEMAFESTRKGKSLVEWVSPWVAGGQGIDVHAIAPRAQWPRLRQEMQHLLSSFRPYWGSFRAHPLQQKKP